MQGGRIMREIKFRGYSEDLDKWVYGDLLQYRVLPIIFDEECEQHECFHSSIGQSTGLFDKNGVEIWEGDIVIAWSQGYQATGEVKQRIDGLWLMYPAYQHGKQWGLCPNPKGGTTVEVIGNIHDWSEE